MAFKCWSLMNPYTTCFGLCINAAIALFRDRRTNYPHRTSERLPRHSELALPSN